MSRQRKATLTVTGWTTYRPDAPEPWSTTATIDDGNGPREVRITEVDQSAYQIEGATVHDGLTDTTYRVTVRRDGGKPRITRLLIEPPAGRSIDAKALAAVPLARIADAAAQYLDELDKLGPDRPLMLLPQGVRGHGFVPDLAELGRQMTEGGKTRAEIVAEYGSEYGVSRATVDRWIAQARSEGHLPQLKRRKRRTKTAGGDQPSADAEQ